MKKSDIFLAVSVALYSYLFYQQSLGINFLIFSVIQVLFFYFSHKENTKKPMWIISAIGVLTSSVSILLYGSTLGFVANIISLGALAFSSISPGTSIVLGMFHNIYSILGSMVFVILDIIHKADSSVNKDKSSKRFKTIVIFAISFVIMLFFFSLYRSSNAMFKNITDKIDLSFISVAWLGFTFLGFLLLYGLYKYRTIPLIEKFDLESKNDLAEDGKPNFFDSMLTIGSEKKAGVILFVMLNTLLLLVNMTDVVFLYGGAEIPDGLSHSDIVHQGVNALITSIIMAVGIILFFFRGRLNFIRNNKLILNLSYIWIIQNAFMIISTAYRNHLYISDFLLTYKRIGVYVYLILCIIGLVYTLLKIKNTRTNWYIVRYVGWSFFAVLIFSPLVNWNKIIVNYNFENGKDKIENVDFDYLVNLSPKTLPDVYVRMKNMNEQIFAEYTFIIKQRMGRYLLKQERYDWRSFNFASKKTSNELKNIFSEEEIKNLKAETNYYHRNIRTY